LVFNEQGEVVARYDKIHLFDAIVNDSQSRYQESEHYRPGEKITLVDTPVGRLGLTVCYDLRFPELFAQLRDQGAEIIAVPSAFTWVTGQAHWQPLLQARAIETGCFILAAGQGGQHNEKRKTWGHSQIVDPWGSVMAEIEQGPGTVCATIDLNQLQDVRKQLPVFEHRQQRKQRLDW
jgi:predicted amidohydrolase